jgi:hypothetical protein
MDSQPASLQVLEERIAKLEGQNRRFKRLGIAGLVGVALLLAMGQAPARKSVEASEFVVKDAAGHARIRIGVDPTNDTAELWLQTAKGDQGASLSDNGLLLKQNGSVRTVVQNGNIALGNSHGVPNVRLSADDDAERDLFIEGRSGFLQYLPGHALEIADSDGYETSIGSTPIRGAASGPRQTNAASVTLLDPDQKVIWKAP